MNMPRLDSWFTPPGSAVIAVLLIILLAALCGCRKTDRPLAEPAPAAATVNPPAVAAAAADAAIEVQDFAGDTAEELQETVIAQVIPVVLETQQAVVEALPPPAPEPSPVSSPVAPAAVALIVRHEIISPGYYTAKLQGFACPGDTSGPTVGIGSDLGVHTPTRIASDWSIHPHVGTLQLGSGQIGFGKCRAYRRTHADVRTPFEMAETVFATKMLPAYRDLARRVFRNGWDLLTENAQGSLVVAVFVRGGGMRDPKGSPGKRAEMRELRDVCVPAGDVQCIARAHRAMCRRYEGRKDAAGLCKRFRETADLAVRA